MLNTTVQAGCLADTSLGYVALSQKLLYAVRTEKDITEYELQLQQANEDTLHMQLSDDNKVKAFWLNIYNAYVQITLKNNPGAYQKRGEFFKKRRILIAGQSLSLDDIEHGLLRRSKVKWSLGHLSKWFPGRFEKKFRASKVDPRIHFALNCGAKSCPPIAFYDDRNLERQLQQAAQIYLNAEAQYDSINNIAYLPAIMSWFRKDFGGKKQMKSLLREMNIIPIDVSPKIRFKKYDWNLFLSNYSREE